MGVRCRGSKSDLPLMLHVRNIVPMANILSHTDYDSIVVTAIFNKWLEQKIDHALLVVKFCASGFITRGEVCNHGNSKLQYVLRQVDLCYLATLLLGAGTMLLNKKMHFLSEKFNEPFELVFCHLAIEAITV